MLKIKPALTEQIFVGQPDSGTLGLDGIREFVCENSLLVTVVCCLIAILLYRHFVFASERGVAKKQEANVQGPTDGYVGPASPAVRQPPARQAAMVERYREAAMPKPAPAQAQQAPARVPEQASDSPDMFDALDSDDKYAMI